MKQGPTTIKAPSITETVCSGCVFLNITAGMRGHKSVTNHYSCTHTDFKNQRLLSNENGKTIHYNHEGDCTTPYWCPFLNKKKELPSIKELDKELSHWKPDFDTVGQPAETKSTIRQVQEFIKMRIGELIKLQTEYKGEAWWTEKDDIIIVAKCNELEQIIQQLGKKYFLD